MAHRFILAGAVLALLAAPPADAMKWKVLEGCTLWPSEANDGDSFHVRYKRSHYIFRLYFVDSPETDDSVPERVTEQAEWWRITEKDALRIGKDAADFSRKWLQKGPFTVSTKLQDARGRSEKNRYFAIVQRDEEYLAEELVRNGYARIYGVDIDLPDGTPMTTFTWRLKTAEREAKREGLGVWAKPQTAASPAAMQSPFLQPSPAQPQGTPATTALLPSIVEHDRILQRITPIYSLITPGKQFGTLPPGASVRILKLEGADMVRIRFKTPAGQLYEAQCRRADIGL